MIKQTRFRKGVTAVGLLCLFGQGCGTKSVQATHPRTASLKTSSKPPKNPYKKLKPAQISEYLETVYRSSQTSRIRVMGKEPAAEMSFEARKIAARIEQEPENLELTKQLARILIREGHLVEAFETLDQIRSFPATDPEIEGGLALVWQKLGSTSSALYHAQQVVLLDRSAANLALLGKIQLQRADYGKALETLKEAHLSYPESQGLVLALARAAAGVSDWEAARSYFERTLELHPESVPAREGLATALVRLDEVNHAFSELRPLFAEDETYARLGQELMAAERWGEAQKALKKALEYSPENRELALKLATVDSYLPFPTVVFLNLGDGIAIDVQSITLQPVYSVVELRGGQVLISTPELEPGIGADRAFGGINPSVGMNLFSMDAVAEPGPYSSEAVEKEFFRRYVSPNVVELVELPMESRDPVVSLAEFSPASPVSLPASQSISAGLQEVADTAAAPGWDGAELAQLSLSRSSRVIQLVNGTEVASDESGAAVLNDTEPFEEQEIDAWELEMEVPTVRSEMVESSTSGTSSHAGEMADLNPAAALDEQVTVSVPEKNSRSAEPALEPEPAARETVPDSAPAGSDKSGYQVENQPQVVQFLLEAWGIPVEEGSEGVSPDQWQIVPASGQSSGNLSVESVLDERGISLSAEAGIVGVEVDAVDEDFAPALEAEVTEAARVDPEMEAAIPLQSDLPCQLQGSTPASRAIPIIDSLMEEDFRQEGWTLRSDLNGGMAAESDARAMRNQPFTLWLPLTGLAVLALLGFLLRRRKPAALDLESNSEREN